VDLLRRARELYQQGQLHDALEAAQAACEQRPKDAEAWWLLACVSRCTGMPAASDEAFRRAAQLNGERPLPHRVGRAEFQAMVDEAVGKLSVDASRRLAKTRIRVEAVPGEDDLRAGTPADALSSRSREPHDVLTLYQVNHENRAGSEAALRNLVARTLARA
jgi:tetratricopeptide (TPR) repeat protein